MAKTVVVGAGLSGLTAALNLAKAGHEVTVLEKFGKAGGIPYTHPSVDATPIFLDKLSAFTGIDLREPYVNRVTQMRTYMYGKKFTADAEGMPPMYSVERGSRKTALDHYIYTLCVDAGVKFEFNHPISNQVQMADLPPGTIIACGLSADAFDALSLPYDMCYGFVTNVKIPDEKNNSTMGWFGKFSDDYAYIATANNVAFGLFFQRRPVTDTQRDAWLESVEEDEGIAFKKVFRHTGPVPTSLANRPHLFHGDKILAGTIAGMMEPKFLFGVHGALVSGKIAAMAYDDQARAHELFQEYNKYFMRTLISKKIMNKAPEAYKKYMLSFSRVIAETAPWLNKVLYPRMMRAIPGYGQLP